MAQRRYTPWRGDRHRAVALLYGLPALLGGAGWLAPDYWAVAAGAAALSILTGWRLNKRVQARQYGQAVEATYSGRAIKELERAGFRVEVGHMTRYGDIDLIAHRPGWTATVEIKAFRYWRGRLRDSARQRRARLQARRQRQSVGADIAVIWLPKAWPTWLTHLLNWLLPERNPVVVMGTARWLARELARHACGRPTDAPRP